MFQGTGWMAANYTEIKVVRRIFHDSFYYRAMTFHLQFDIEIIKLYTVATTEAGQWTCG